jgi:hypothetical protein
MKKQLFFLVVFCLFVFQAIPQNVGIGNTNPAYKLDINGRMRIRGGADFTNSAGLWLGGTGSESEINKAFIGIRSDTTIGFYGNTGSGWSFLMDIRNGNVGIGNDIPINKAGLTVDKIVGATHAIFGSYTTGVAIESNFPGIGFNTYYDGTNRAIANGYGGYIGVNSSGGGMQFAISSAAGTTGNPITVTPALYIKPGGNIGIGNTDPQAQLQFSNLVQNRKIVLYTVNNNDHQFYGFGINGFTLRYQVQGVSDSHVFYSGADAGQSNELFRISGNGNVGVGVSDPGYRLDLGARMRIRSSPGNSAGIWLNNSANNASPAFMGMNTDNEVGFYGSNGASWGLTMNTQTGALSLNGNAGQPGQVMMSTGNNAAKWATASEVLPVMLTEGTNLINTNLTEQGYTGSDINLNLSQNTLVLLFCRIKAEKGCFIAPCSFESKIELFLNGVRQPEQPRFNGTVYTTSGGYDNKDIGPFALQLGPGNYNIQIWQFLISGAPVNFSVKCTAMLFKQ